MINPTLTGGLETDALKILTSEKISSIHRASMKVLSETGMQIDHPEILEKFQSRGVRVDTETNRVFLDEETIMAAVETNPSTITIYGRDDDEKNIVLGGKRVYLGTGGTAVNILDLDRKRRKTTIADVAATARLVDALENIHFFVIPCYPDDSKPEDADVNRFFNAMNNTTKPIITSCFSKNGLERIISMASIAAGGDDALAQPLFCSSNHHGHEDILVPLRECGIRYHECSRRSAGPAL